MKLLALAAAAVLTTATATATAASADTFYFQETTLTDTFSFALDTAKQTNVTFGHDYGSVPVTSGSGTGSLDVSTVFGYYLIGGHGSSFYFSPSNNYGLASNVNGVETFITGSYIGTDTTNVGQYNSAQTPASLLISTSPIAAPSAVVSAAPEPGAWALLLGGVGILGAMMRVANARRREDELKSIATA